MRPMLVAMLLVSMTTLGCPGSNLRPFDDGGPDGGDGDGDADADGGDGDGDSDDDSCPYFEVRQDHKEKVDILFVVDNSNSMAEEQSVLSDQIVIMIHELISPSDPATPPVDDLHVGIISTDMGTAGYQIQTCTDSMGGDGGVLQNIGYPAGCEDFYNAADCDGRECPWLVHSSEVPDDGTDPGNPPIWEDFGCIATLGTNGCGFEQQMEASLAALTTQADPGRPNEGFLRDDSLLVIVYVSDEDDCSTGNGEMFNPSRDDYGPLNVRCALNPEELYPIERYRDAFVELRGGDMDRVVVAAITGVPIDGRWNPGDPIEQLRDQQIVDPSNPSVLLKSCETEMGAATPPVRFAELVYAFEDNGILESICRSDWTPALQAVTRKIQENLGGACLLRPFMPESLSSCRMVEFLSDDRACPHLVDQADDSRTTGWQADLGLDERGHRMCEILPADYDHDGCPDGRCDCEDELFAGCLQGWFLDPRAHVCEHGGIRLTDPALVAGSSDIVFECLEGCE